MISLFMTPSGFLGASASKKGKNTAINDVFEYDFADDCVSSGTIFDKEKFLETIISMKNAGLLKDKNIELILDSPQIVTRVVNAVSVKEKELFPILEKEFYDRNDSSEKLYTYYKISENKSARVSKLIASVVKRDYIETFIDLFEKAGIPLAGVRSSLMCFISFLQNEPAIKDKDCIIQVYGENYVDNILFVKGKYFYSGRNSIFAQRGSEAYAMEGVRGISNIIQFARAQKAADGISEVMTAGLDDESFARIEENALLLDPNIQMRKISDGNGLPGIICEPQRLNKFLMPITNTVLSAQTLSYKYYLKKYAKKDSKATENLKLAAPFIVTATVVVLAIAGLLGVSAVKKGQLAELENYLNDPEIIAQGAEADNVAARLNAVLPKANAAESFSESLQSYPVFNSFVLAEINSCLLPGMTMSINNFNSETGEINIDAAVSQTAYANEFVSRLKEKDDIFDEVIYTGYSFDDNKKLWTINIQCFMSRGAGRI